MKKSIFFLTILFFSIAVYSQVNQEWVARYDGPGSNYDEANAVAVDQSGNVFITGQSEQSLLNFDCATIKYNSYGGEEWVQRFNGSENQTDIGKSIAVVGSGDVYVLAQSHVNFVTFKYTNLLGNELWKKILNNCNGAATLVLDNQTNIYVTGAGDNNASNNNDYTTIKYNILGTEQWIAQYSGPDSLDDGASDITVDNYGNVYVTGIIGGYISSDYATVKYNHLGVVQWSQTYNGPADFDDGAIAIALDDSGNVYVTGSSEQSYGVRDYATIKYNSTGVLRWVNRFNFVGDDVAKDIAVDGEGNVYVTGWSEGIGTSTDYATIMYSSAGVQQWVARYNGPDSLGDGAYALALDASGNVYVTGGSTKDWYEDCVTVKYNPNGSEIWVQRYNGPGNQSDQGKAIAVDDAGNVYVTGGSYGDGTKTDYVTIKYSQPAGIEPISKYIPTEYNLFQNYPNPFNPATTIEFSIPKSEFISLKVYDILGEEVATVVADRLSAGNHKYTWDTTGLAGGIYFYRLESGSFTETKKMILLK
jgi:hypothetical protein